LRNSSIVNLNRVAIIFESIRMPSASGRLHPSDGISVCDIFPDPGGIGSILRLREGGAEEKEREREREEQQDLSLFPEIIRRIVHRSAD